MPALRAMSLVVAPGLAADADAWDGLVATLPVPSPFLRGWWLDAVSPSPAHHLLVKDGETLVGGVTLRRDRILGVPRFRFAGQGVLCPDHLDLVARPGWEADVAAAVRGWFTGPGTRLLDLTGLPPDSALARALGGPAHQVDVAPYEPLPENPDDYLAGRSTNFRRSVRKSDRRLTDAGVRHRRVDPSTLPAALESFRLLQDDREGRGALLGELPVLGAALAAGLARGEARVDVLETATGAVAVSVAFTVAGRLSLYQVARSLEHEHRSAATVLLHRVIVDAIADGCREVDLLRGGEGYKASFADSSRGVFRMRVGHGLPARAVVAAWSAAGAARRRAAALVRRGHRSV